MAKDHLDNKRGNLLPSFDGSLLPISNKGSFISTIPQRRTCIPRPLARRKAAWMRMAPLRKIDPTSYRTLSWTLYHRALSASLKCCSLAGLICRSFPRSGICKLMLMKQIFVWYLRHAFWADMYTVPFFVIGLHNGTVMSEMTLQRK